MVCVSACVCPLVPLTNPTVLLGFLLPWKWGISSWLLQQSADAPPYLGQGVPANSHPSWPWTWSSSFQPSCYFRGLECKSRKSRNAWSNRQIWSWSTEWSRSKSNRVLPREHTGHSKYSLPTTQERTLHMDITRRSIPKSDWLYYLQPKMEKLYKIKNNKTWSWLWLRSSAPYCKIQIQTEESREKH